MLWRTRTETGSRRPLDFLLSLRVPLFVAALGARRRALARARWQRRLSRGPRCARAKGKPDRAEAHRPDPQSFEAYPS